MKLFKYAPLCLTALALTACSNDDNIDGTNGKNTEGTTSYVAININNVGTTPSGLRHRIRGAVAPEYNPSDSDNGIYEDGTTEESTIKKVRFYFFNADGTPYLLQNPSAVSNHLDVDVQMEGSADHSHTVENQTKAVLVINGTEKTQPTSIIAVANPDALQANVLKDQMTLAQLTDANLITNVAHNNTNGFAMTNSSYVSGGVAINATSCVGYVKDKKEVAENNPVDIYVERIDAKVTTSVDATTPADYDAATQKFKVGTITYYETPVGTATPTQKTATVYATIKGWGIADENGKAQVIKQVDTNWTNDALGINPWSTADYHRSYWATSVPITESTGTNPIVNHSYNDLKNSLGSALYTLPNTPTITDGFDKANIGSNQLTKMLVTAKLTYKINDTDPEQVAEICSYRGNQYITKIYALNAVAANYANYFTRTGDEASGYTYTSLTGSDIEFVLPTSTGEGTAWKDYQVTCQLKSSVDKVYNKKVDGTYEEATETLKTALGKEVAECRTDGQAYYYTAIRHLASDITKLGYYGVVRNHSYKISINSIKGFGTPVFDQTRVIDPTVPQDADTYLAAKIKVLSWRVVKSNVDLGQ